MVLDEMALHQHKITVFFSEVNEMSRLDFLSGKFIEPKEAQITALGVVNLATRGRSYSFLPLAHQKETSS
jgi:hypothetical protein